MVRRQGAAGQGMNGSDSISTTRRQAADRFSNWAARSVPVFRGVPAGRQRGVIPLTRGAVKRVVLK
jgi:hypothetical protein